MPPLARLKMKTKIFKKIEGQCACAYGCTYGMHDNSKTANTAMHKKPSCKEEEQVLLMGHKQAQGKHAIVTG